MSFVDLERRVHELKITRAFLRPRYCRNGRSSQSQQDSCKCNLCQKNFNQGKKKTFERHMPSDEHMRRLEATLRARTMHPVPLEDGLAAMRLQQARFSLRRGRSTRWCSTDALFPV